MFLMASLFHILKGANKSFLPYGSVPYDLTVLLAFGTKLSTLDSALKQHKLAALAVTNCFTTAIKIAQCVSKKLFDF